MNKQLLSMSWSFTWRFLVILTILFFIYLPLIEFILFALNSKGIVFQVIKSILGLVYITGTVMLTFIWIIKKKIIVSSH